MQEITENRGEAAMQYEIEEEETREAEEARKAEEARRARRREMIEKGSAAIKGFGLFTEISENTDPMRQEGWCFLCYY